MHVPMQDRSTEPYEGAGPYDCSDEKTLGLPTTLI